MAGFYGIPVDSTEIVFVIDRSASMRGPSGTEGMNRWEMALAETLGVVDKLPKTAKVNVIFFMSDVWAWRPEITTMSTSARRALRRDLAKQTPSGGTYLYDALHLALQDTEVETIYVLSDGNPTGGKFVAAADILREIGGLNRLRRAVIHCVAIGHSSPLMRQLAEQNGVRFVSK